MSNSTGPRRPGEQLWQRRKREREAVWARDQELTALKALKAATETKAHQMYHTRREAESDAARLRSEIAAITAAWQEHRETFGPGSDEIFRRAISNREIDLAGAEIDLALNDWIPQDVRGRV